MRKLAGAIFICLFFIACSHNDTLPANVLPIAKMKSLVWDMEYADQTAVNKFVLARDSQRMEATSLYQQVLANHKTDKKTFYNSFAYYEAHPDKMKVLFDSVTSYGNRQKAGNYKKTYNAVK